MEKFVSYVSLNELSMFRLIFVLFSYKGTRFRSTDIRPRCSELEALNFAQRLNSIGFVEFPCTTLPNPVRLLIIVFDIVERPALGLGQKPVEQNRS